MSNSRGFKQDTDKVLLVEGTNDAHVVAALCNAHTVPETFGIYECGSDQGVLKRLNALIIRPNPPQVIGVMLDADLSLEGRWTSIRSKLKHYNYAFPNVPDVGGTVVDGTVIEGDSALSKLGFWLMPDNRSPGMLEDFCAELAEPDSLAFAQQCVQQASERKVVTFKDVHQSKAVIHTYLAWQDEPGSPLGQSITRQALRPHTAIAESFTGWLTALFA
jgi:hypothetical protein